MTVLLNVTSRDLESLKECKCRRTTRRECGVVGQKRRGRRKVLISNGSEGGGGSWRWKWKWK